MMSASEAVQEIWTEDPCQESSFIQLPHATIHYEKFFASSSAQETPLVILHGGPGSTNDALYSFAELANTRPVIFYEQGGCGQSTMHDERFVDWTLNYYVEELTDFIDRLGYEKVYLLGISWGGMLATAYAQHHQEKIEKLILVSPCLNAQYWVQDCQHLAKNLSQDLYETMMQHEANGTTGHEAYQQAAEIFYKNFFCRVPWTQPLITMMERLNRTIYETMWGKYEMTATGNLKEVDVTPVLATLNMPVLIVAGQYDMARPERMQSYVQQIPNACLEIIPNSGHMTPFEQPEKLVFALRKFLN